MKTINNYFKNQNGVKELFHDVFELVNNKNEDNFSTVNIKQYRQKMFKGDNRGICGITSIYSAFKDYIVKDINIKELTKLSKNTINIAQNLKDYFNDKSI